MASWQPVKNGTYFMTGADWVTVDGDQLCTGYRNETSLVTLLDNYRLCELVEAAPPAPLTEAAYKAMLYLDELFPDGLPDGATDLLTLAGCSAREQLRAALQGIDAQPAMPRPDWTQAPEWATWWAVDADGYAWWYRYEPQQDATSWYDDESFSAHGKSFKNAYHVDIPLGVDWRTLKFKRPETEVKG